MERLNQRLETARRALETLAELADLSNPSRVERDAAIQRFEYTVEAVWKAAQALLLAEFGVEAASPKQTVRVCAQNAVLDEEAAREALAMIDDRNLTSHTYNEKVAQAIFSRLSRHNALMGRWLAAMVSAVDSSGRQP